MARLSARRLTPEPTPQKHASAGSAEGRREQRGRMDRSAAHCARKQTKEGREGQARGTIGHVRLRGATRDQGRDRSLHIKGRDSIKDATGGREGLSPRMSAKRALSLSR